MLSIEQVLVPLDFSASSRAALAMALAMGDARIQPVHVLERWPAYMEEVLFPYAALGEDAAHLEHELREMARAHLDRFFEFEPSRRFIEGPKIEIGAPKARLPEMIHSNGPDLVVMGAFGTSGVFPESLGSTAERVLRTVLQPVLLAREYDQRPKVGKILVALDLLPRSSDVLAAALGIASLWDAELEAIFVIPDPSTQDPHGLLRAQVKLSNHKLAGSSQGKVDALFERALETLEVPYPQKPRISALKRKMHVAVGAPPAEILRRAEESAADLVVLGSRNAAEHAPHHLGRVAWTVARTAPQHVLIVPLESPVRLLGGEE